jgi:hypothetical protein
VPTPPPNWRKVKSSSTGASNAVNQHDRAKDYPPPGETAKLLMTYRGLCVSGAVGRRRDETGSRLRLAMVRRLKGDLSAEQPLAGDKLCAIKPYAATRTAALPGVFVPERSQPFARQAVNYLIDVASKVPTTHQQQKSSVMEEACLIKRLSESTPFDPADAPPIRGPAHFSRQSLSGWVNSVITEHRR